MNKYYYKRIQENWPSIVKLYTKNNWSTHKIARVLFKNEQEYFWRIYRLLKKEGITKDPKEKMKYVRGFTQQHKKSLKKNQGLCTDKQRS